MIAVLTPEASTWMMLILGFGALGFAAFSVGMKVGQRDAEEWWKRKLQEARTSTPLPAYEHVHPSRVSLRLPGRHAGRRMA
jgi:hypothetical protein